MIKYLFILLTSCSSVLPIGNTPESYGAIANDAVNDQSAIAKCFDQAKDNSTIVFSGGGYICDNLTVNKSINLKFENNSYLEVNGSIRYSGSLGGFQTIENIKQGNKYLTFPNDLKKQDILYLSTSSAFDGNQEYFMNQEGNFKGQIVQVHYVSGDTVFLLEPIEDSYNSVRVAKINPLTVTMYGLDLRGKNQRTELLRCEWLVNSTFDNCKISGSGHTALALWNCYRTTVDKAIMNDLCYNTNQTTGNDYGIVTMGCWYVNIINSNIHGGRHAIDISGLHSTSSHVRIEGNSIGKFLPFGTSAMSTHLNVNNLSIVNNDIRGGLGIRSPNCIIEGNNIYEFADENSGSLLGIQIFGNSDYYIVKNNKINGYRGIYVSFINSGSCDYIIIEGNTLNLSGFGLDIYNIPENKDTINYFIIRNNDFFMDKDGFPLWAIHYYGSVYTKNLFITGNNIFNTSTGEAYPYFQSGKVDMFIFNNYVEGNQAKYDSEFIYFLK